jgi:excisionase family DNA binding protein
MRGRSAGDTPRGSFATNPTPAQPLVAAALAEHLGEINKRWGQVAQLLAELSLTPALLAAPPAADGPERMWKLQQVADAWGVSGDTVRAWVHAGDLKTVPVGREYRVPDSECERFMRDHIRATAAVRPAA